MKPHASALQSTLGPCATVSSSSPEYMAGAEDPQRPPFGSKIGPGGSLRLPYARSLDSVPEPTSAAKNSMATVPGVDRASGIHSGTIWLSQTPYLVRSQSVSPASILATVGPLGSPIAGLFPSVSPPALVTPRGPGRDPGLDPA
ncbi:hypothetical protein VTN77DRAFT_356 [Rasamsonia byssochlamydoides]|uniref:uncharacterized protein n=1 Tax=Rasamsonia byssochlamydoides TaxID=89139 RepID=UPI003743CC9B